MSTREAYRAELDLLLKGFADNIRRLRDAKETGYSQEQLWMDAGLHRTAVGKFEQARSEPSSKQPVDPRQHARMHAQRPSRGPACA